eukprot:892625-Pyramimonas_sp.AAC.1
MRSASHDTVDAHRAWRDQIAIAYWDHSDHRHLCNRSHFLCFHTTNAVIERRCLVHPGEQTRCCDCSCRYSQGNQASSSPARRNVDACCSSRQECSCRSCRRGIHRGLGGASLTYTGHWALHAVHSCPGCLAHPLPVHCIHGDMAVCLRGVVVHHRPGVVRPSVPTSYQHGK